jgi:starch phosphorylase
MAKGEKALRYLTQYDLAMDKESIKRSFANHVEFTYGKDEYSATRMDFFNSIALSVRDRMCDRWNKTQQAYYNRDAKRVYYLSMEFLIGRLLEDGLVNLGIRQQTREAIGELGISLEELIECEWDAGLGNGGLGRLAACFLDSMATLGIPAMGYGLLYEYGIFKQIIANGAQSESPDNWLRYGNPWQLARPERLYPVRFFGRVQETRDEQGRTRFSWVGTEDVMAMAFDVPVPGYRNEEVNTLRLWAAKSTREFDLHYFNEGNYIQAIQGKNAMENISRVLYPADHVEAGRELRLKQEYFLVSATLQDAVLRHLKNHPTVGNLHEKAVFQLNDTHPALAIPELMRILMDERGMGWEEAWEVSRHCFAYTNHTVLPEALEQWPVAMLEKMLPRHLQIIYEINRRFLERVRLSSPNDEGRVQRVSLIEEHPEKRVRMANLAIEGSFSVNGVSVLHSNILVERIFRDFAELYPDKFNNKTNGITPRRWLLKCNPGLAALISEAIGDGWVTDLSLLERLRPLADDGGFRARWQAVKRANKERLAAHMRKACYPEMGGLAVDPSSLFDVQVKRIHEYKRQLLNALHVVALYLRYRSKPPRDGVPRTFIFSGKAAPSYFMAKLIIRLINAIASVVNQDPAVNRLLKVAFVPNYGVSLAELIIPAADLSEQISTAGTEASGTGNMKLSLNGALTIGTLDGANIEILEATGQENFFTFGLTDEQIQELRGRGYDPKAVYQSDETLRAVLDSIAGNLFCPREPGLFQPIVDSLLRGGDTYLVLADFEDYLRCQERVSAAFGDWSAWNRKSILTVAGMGRFSSDHTILQYAREIWGIEPAPRLVRPAAPDGGARPASAARHAGRTKSASAPAVDPGAGRPRPTKSAGTAPSHAAKRGATNRRRKPPAS